MRAVRSGPRRSSSEIRFNGVRKVNRDLRIEKSNPQETSAQDCERQGQGYEQSEAARGDKSKPHELKGLRHQSPSASPDQYEQEHLKIEEGMLRHTKTISRLTGALVFVGIVTALILIVHAFIFDRTDDTSRTAQRAFVFLREIHVDPPKRMSKPAGDVSYSMRAVWENTGGTETQDLVVNSFIAVSSEYEWPKTSADQGKARSLPPHQFTEIGAMGLAGHHLNGARNSNDIVAIYGFAKYRDAFKNKHLTLACLKLRLSEFDYRRGVGSFEFEQCHEYNCTDQECKRYAGDPRLDSLLSYLE